MIWWSAGLGIFSLVGMAGALLLAGEFKDEVGAQAIGLLMAVFSLLPSIIGLSLGLGARDKRLKNPGFIWVGVICNGVTVAIWILLTIAGSMAH